VIPEIVGLRTMARICTARRVPDPCSLLLALWMTRSWPCTPTGRAPETTA